MRLYGGFSTDFTARDPVAHPTLIQPDNASGAKSREALLTFTKAIGGTVVDGFIFDMGLRNSHHATEGRPDGVETAFPLSSGARWPARGVSRASAHPIVGLLPSKPTCQPEAMRQCTLRRAFLLIPGALLLLGAPLWGRSAAALLEEAPPEL